MKKALISSITAAAAIGVIVAGGLFLAKWRFSDV